MQPLRGRKLSDKETCVSVYYEFCRGKQGEKTDWEDEQDKIQVKRKSRKEDIFAFK